MRQALELALEAIESACKRIDELKAENKTLKEALAQPEQEPVALQYPQKDINWQQEQQIKAQASIPPQRTWVGLTDAEVKKIVGSDRYTDLLVEVVKIVEAKLKEKNND